MQNDKETETLVRFIDDTEHRLGGADPEARERLMDLLGRLMELRGTYQLTRLAGEADLQDAALRHEAAVEDVFGRLAGRPPPVLELRGHRRGGARLYRDMSCGDAVGVSFDG